MTYVKNPEKALSQPLSGFFVKLRFQTNTVQISPAKQEENYGSQEIAGMERKRNEGTD